MASVGLNVLDFAYYDKQIVNILIYICELFLLLRSLALDSNKEMSFFFLEAYIVGPLLCTVQ